MSKLKHDNSTEIIEKLFEILTELDARNTSANEVVPNLQGVSWGKLCHQGQDLFRQLEG